MAFLPLEFLPEGLLLGAALLVFLLDALGVRRLELLGGIVVAAAAIDILLVLADLGLAPIAALATLPSSAVDASPSASLLAFTSLGLVFQAVFLTALLLVALASLSLPSDSPGSAVYFGLLATATLGMLLVAVADDLIVLLLALEITSISTYLLVGYSRRDPRSLEAAMKFYIVGALSTSLSFFGASLLFGAYGSTEFVAIGESTQTVGYPTLALLGFGLLIAGIGFKVTAVPFHAWAVDVYDGAPTEISAFLTGGSKKMGLYAFFLLFLGPIVAFGPGRLAAVAAGAWDPGPTLQLTFGLLAVLTMTFGNLLALLQREMKRMLAYSSISQAGYMLIGLSVATAPAIAGASFQVVAHVFMKTGAFLIVAAVAALGVGPLIDDWKGLGQTRPGLAFAFALCLLSLAGVPLTVGFASKFVLFSAAVEAKGYFVWLAVAGLLNSALSVFYYARVLKVIYLEPPSASPGGPPSASPLAFGGLGWGRATAIGLVVVAILLFGLLPNLLLPGLQHAASQFVAVGG